MKKQSKKVKLGVIQHAALENSHLNIRNLSICQHCGVKTSTVTPSFYYVFNISLSCNINIPSFIENLWWDLLLGNHLNKIILVKFGRQTKFVQRVTNTLEFGFIYGVTKTVKENHFG